MITKPCQTLDTCHSFNPCDDPARKTRRLTLKITYFRLQEVKWSAQGH